MEKLEAELITKLQKSQALRENAFEKLENALTMPASEFAKKYLDESKKINSDTNSLSIDSNPNKKLFEKVIINFKL